MRRKSLEDKIREAGHKNLDKEYQESANLMDKVISFKKNDAIPQDNKTKKKTLFKNNRPSDRVTERPSDQPTTRPSNRVTERPSDRESDRVTERPSDRERDFLIYMNDENNERRYTVDLSKKPDNLTIRQYCVLHYIYFNRPFKVESNDGLGKIKNMGSNNAKNQVHSLYKKGYINKPYSINDGVNKGSTCRVVEKKCYPLFGTTNIINPERISPRSNNTLFNRVTDRPSDRQADRPRALNSSSSLLNKTTTKNYLDSEIEKKLNHPELVYWKEKKLKSRHIQKWMEEFSLPLDDMLESLKHCRFDIVENEIKLIKTPFDYFYGRLKKAGFYHEPRGYITHEQILINREKERLEKTKEEAEKLKKIRQEREKAKIDLEFEKMLEGKGARFKDCESKLNDFELKRRNKKTYHDAMRLAFENLYY